MKPFAFAGILAFLLYLVFIGYDNLCLGTYGTRAYLTGEPSVVRSVCSAYDYKQFYPQEVRHLAK